MRSRNLFQGATRELDPFYTIGALVRRGQWNFLATNTLVTNFRQPPFHGSIPAQGNVSMICDFELSHPVSNHLKGVVAFIRAEPVFNWSSHKVGGLSGTDFRLFGGVRMSLSKQSEAANIDMLRDQLRRQEQHGSSRPPTTSLNNQQIRQSSEKEPLAMVIRQPPNTPVTEIAAAAHSDGSTRIPPLP